ncbi:MAG: carboxypeptidase regulatory-like domain-containing protein [Thermoguttaceae bacterium]|nr:carboxypeptidase regulatory-like domain-containing protein [Thermoguttaceae bacterium]
MATISFFCARCRRLASFSASLRGEVVACPYCRQALIVPDVPAVDDESEEPARETERDGETGEKTNDAAVGAAWAIREKRAGEAEFDVSARSVGATIVSHLASNKTRPENWRRVEREQEKARVWNDTASLVEPEVSDAEFLRRLRAEPQKRAVAPPVAPPILDASAFGCAETASVSGASKAIWGAGGALAIVVAVAVGAFFFGGGKNEEDGVSSFEQSVAREAVFVEGALTYRTPGGSLAADEGAFVFFFPNAERFGAPIAMGDVSPQRPNSPGFADVVAELEKRGARFATTDFEGRFAFDDLEAGEYRVLLVSRRVGDDWANANPKALKEIERFVVGPRLLLGESRFYWTTRRFDGSSTTFEKSFGKAGAPFANVD